MKMNKRHMRNKIPDRSKWEEEENISKINKIANKASILKNKRVRQTKIVSKR